jgi:hypothetical protein
VTPTNAPPRDIEVLGLATLALAAAFATQPLLHLAGAGDPSAPTLLARLAPAQTIDRLWVVFVLVPAAVAFIGIGVPYAFRVLVAGLRGRLEQTAAWSALAIAAAIALVVFELAVGRSGVPSLVLACAAAGWAARSALVALSVRLAPYLFAVAGIALFGLAVYERRLQASGSASVAVAPTLVLSAFYASLTACAGALAAGASALGIGAPASDRGSKQAAKAFARTAAAGLMVSLTWLLAPRLVRGVGDSPDSSEIALTVVAAAAFLVLARFARRAERSSRGGQRR